MRVIKSRISNSRIRRTQGNASPIADNSIARYICYPRDYSGCTGKIRRDYLGDYRRMCNLKIHSPQSAPITGAVSPMDIDSMCLLRQTSNIYIRFNVLCGTVKSAIRRSHCCSCAVWSGGVYKILCSNDVSATEVLYRCCQEY